MAVVLVLTPVTAHTQPEVTAVGTGRTLQIATQNSHISAHFQCGRKGYWADLDSIETIKPTSLHIRSQAVVSVLPSTTKPLRLHI